MLLQNHRRPSLPLKIGLLSSLPFLSSWPSPLVLGYTLSSNTGRCRNVIHCNTEMCKPYFFTRSFHIQCNSFNIFSCICCRHIKIVMQGACNVIHCWLASSNDLLTTGCEMRRLSTQERVQQSDQLHICYILLLKQSDQLHMCYMYCEIENP